MKRMIASAGLVVLGAASVHAAAYAPGFASTDLSQPWTVSATLRGFYDDNYATLPDFSSGTNSAPKRGSFGIEVSPSVAAAFSTDQTDLAARYTFGAYWYEDRERRHVDAWDYTHQFDGYLSHTFNDRYNVLVIDSFIMTKEGALLDPTLSSPYRTLNDNWRNTGTITLTAQLTQLLTLVLGYSNNYYDYKQNANDVLNNYVTAYGSTDLVNYPWAGDTFIPGGSYSALLNRDEHLILVNLKWQLSPQTVGILGYNFGLVDFTGNDYLAQGWGHVDPVVGQMVIWNYQLLFGIFPEYVLDPKSSLRNSYNHYGYIGVDHSFNPDFTMSVRAGAQYAIYYNDPSGYTTLSPYVNATMRYTYGPGSYVEAGFNEFINQTDVAAYNATVSSVYATVNHAFTPQLTGSLIGQFQYSSYNSQTIPGFADYNGQSDNYYLLGLDLAYRFNRHVSADVGYNLDRLDSTSTARYPFTRNRVYFGVTATY